VTYNLWNKEKLNYPVAPGSNYYPNYLDPMPIKTEAEKRVQIEIPEVP
jgi:hypothetical protein